MAALADVGVLITRPERQADHLSDLFRSYGAAVVRWPVMQIEPAGDRDALTATLNPHDPFDLVLFTSANAARFGAPLWHGQPRSPVAAIGPATARALEQQGFAAVWTPATGFDSEHLLLHPALANPGGKRVLVVTGEGGRELLRDQLIQREARVVVAAVYRRTRMQFSAAAMHELEGTLSSGVIDVITATSTEIAGFFLDLATPVMRPALDEAHWLVPGDRVAAALRKRGVTAPILRADSAEDHDLLAAVLRWRSSESAA